VASDLGLGAEKGRRREGKRRKGRGIRDRRRREREREVSRRRRKNLCRQRLKKQRQGFSKHSRMLLLRFPLHIRISAAAAEARNVLNSMLPLLPLR
jgi:hypothetical protein